MSTLASIPTTADGSHDMIEGGLDPVEAADPRSWPRRHGLSLSIAGLLTTFFIIFFWPYIVITVHPGEEGVLWRRFLGGTDIDTVYLEGTHAIFPWDAMFVYDIRLNTVDHVIEVLSTDGLQINVSTTIRYRPMAKSVPQLHKQVGPGYVDRIIIPEVITAVREVMGKYRPEQLYTLQTDEMQGQILARAATQVRERFLVVDNVLIRRIELPISLQRAIESKLNQEQQALEYAFRVDKEKQEKERKRVESEGLALWKSQVRADTPQLLQWKGIEATLELARSTNSKVIVIGGKDGLPIIINPGTQ